MLIVSQRRVDHHVGSDVYLLLFFTPEFVILFGTIFLEGSKLKSQLYDFKNLKDFCVRDGWSDGMEGYPGLLVPHLHHHHHSFSCISISQVSHPTKKIFKKPFSSHSLSSRSVRDLDRHLVY